MVKSLPPLSTLRSFEAVARQLSFSKAAVELHVTPGAVSQQIRSLEELLDMRLFERTIRSVALTDAGLRMLPDIQAGLEILARAINSKISPIGERTLTSSRSPCLRVAAAEAAHILRAARGHRFEDLGHGRACGFSSATGSILPSRWAMAGTRAFTRSRSSPRPSLPFARQSCSSAKAHSGNPMICVGARLDDLRNHRLITTGRWRRARRLATVAEARWRQARVLALWCQVHTGGTRHAGGHRRTRCRARAQRRAM